MLSFFIFYNNLELAKIIFDTPDWSSLPTVVSENSPTYELVITSIIFWGE